MLSRVDFMVVDSVLGSHSADLVNFRATADSCSALKFTKNYESTTATPRIVKKAICNEHDSKILQVWTSASHECGRAVVVLQDF